MELTTTPVREQQPVKSKSAKSRFYKWHRIIGLIALIPVISWSLSGLSHPFMSNWFRPFIPKEVFKPSTQQQMHPALTIKQVLDKNGITEIRNFSLVSLGTQPWYQVLGRDSAYHYFSAIDGEFIPDGDRRYALYLARYFTQDQKHGVKDMTLQTSFDSEYQPINRLLPVWKVSFNRPDGMDVYIETGQSRMGTFNNNTRKAFLVFFQQCHTWRFLESIGGEGFRIAILMIVVVAMLLSLISGLVVYGLYWNRFKEITQKRKAKNGKDQRFVHRFHRQLGLIVSFVMLAFAVSGGFHLLVKLHNLSPDKKQYAQLINTAALVQSNLNFPVADSTIKRVSLISFNNRHYYQVLNAKKQLRYFDTQTSSELENGDMLYAQYLANYYRNSPAAKADSIIIIKSFNNEYGFINKRLPVEKVSYAGNENWYIETSSAKLATKVAGIDRAEGLSFIFLHKYFGMAWAGKDARDIVSMLSALGVLVVSVFGFAAFIKNK
ncbi:PepSY domain-containing protein [Mucilaginibacter sp. Bleaf8]|uniref:PepSY-associated TM helix domain-containing protein n=1 Tax=Mucilaginibacter sp. Bleaf8 TaxID=2834430 RepID=UPI001BCBF17C|nr:PepSY-associated TM helix domain-containing protein [Mucilaginibacter sp. Bleaf8]MBS7564846.1 PepSY domain-containing protein [Mucilaginibacter sp. Bleaf8]